MKAIESLCFLEEYVKDYYNARFDICSYHRLKEMRFNARLDVNNARLDINHNKVTVA